MSIASAFNEITVAQGGTASKSGSITGAIDKLNDVLAGSDQPGAETIEQAIRLLGQHIGGGLQTATLTVVNNTAASVNLQVPNIIEYEGDKILNNIATTKKSSTKTFDVPMVGVTACIVVTEGVSVSASGDIDGEDGEYYMTGDATLTVS